MKKIVLVVALVAFLGAGTAFAEKPTGLGIGVVAGYGGLGSSAGTPLGISLKIPSVPLYWGLYFNLPMNLTKGYSAFGLGITGDYMILQGDLVSSMNLGYYLGAGVFFDIYFQSYKETHLGSDVTGDRMDMAVGLRVPIGLTWMLAPAIELFLDVGLGFGAQMQGEEEWKWGGSTLQKHESKIEFGFYYTGSLGVRFYL